jgi:hypothetical protein
MGIRTSFEIEAEREALKLARGDFDGLTRKDASFLAAQEIRWAQVTQQPIYSPYLIGCSGFSNLNAESC